MTPEEFEHHCAAILRSSGYRNVKVTQFSGDQGIDVFATKKGKKYAVQCKLYSGTVGNKAVQEAYAGKAFYNCDIAMVMTNSVFSKSAEDLARETGVKLWDNVEANSNKTLGCGAIVVLLLIAMAIYELSIHPKIAIVIGVAVIALVFLLIGSLVKSKNKENVDEMIEDENNIKKQSEPDEQEEIDSGFKLSQDSRNEIEKYIKNQNEDELLIKALEFVVTNQSLSVVAMQRRFKISYSRAVHLAYLIKKLGVNVQDERLEKYQDTLEIKRETVSEMANRLNLDINYSDDGSHSKAIGNIFVEKCNTNNVIEIIDALIINYSPDDCSLYILTSDSILKSRYSNIPHLGCNLTDKYQVVISFLIYELDTKLKMIAETNSKNYDEYCKLPIAIDSEFSLKRSVIIIPEVLNFDYYENIDDFRRILVNGKVAGIDVIAFSNMEFASIPIKDLKCMFELISSDELKKKIIEK